MDQNTFAAKYAPKLGPIGLPQTMTAVQLVAFIELQIKKGAITREEYNAELNVQLAKLASVIDVAPILSPIQIQKS